MDDLKYPIGSYTPLDHVTEADIARWISEIEELPSLMRSAVEGLSEDQLDTPYRPDGWTVRQVMHHVSESHLNSIIRFKWALTEDQPTIKAYDQKGWANTADVARTPVETTLRFLEALHAKWVILLQSIEADEWKRLFVHPETGRQLDLHWLLGLYAWHGKHHVAHITGLRERKGW